jgi:hypothetical protein
VKNGKNPAVSLRKNGKRDGSHGKRTKKGKMPTSAAGFSDFGRNGKIGWYGMMDEGLKGCFIGMWRS